jgi:hypothetical protein
MMVMGFDKFVTQITNVFLCGDDKKSPNILAVLETTCRILQSWASLHDEVKIVVCRIVSVSRAI